MHEDLPWVPPRVAMRLATIAAAFVLFSASLAAEGQEAGKMIYRIGVLLGGSRPDTVQVAEAFRQGLRDLGYVEGRNLSIEYRFAEVRQKGVKSRLRTEESRLRVSARFRCSSC